MTHPTNNQMQSAQQRLQNAINEVHVASEEMRHAGWNFNEIGRANRHINEANLEENSARAALAALSQSAISTTAAAANTFFAREIDFTGAMRTEQMVQNASAAAGLGWQALNDLNHAFDDFGKTSYQSNINQNASSGFSTNQFSNGHSYSFGQMNPYANSGATTNTSLSNNDPTPYNGSNSGFVRNAQSIFAPTNNTSSLVSAAPNNVQQSIFAPYQGNNVTASSSVAPNNAQQSIFAPYQGNGASNQGYRNEELLAELLTRNEDVGSQTNNDSNDSQHATMTVNRSGNSTHGVVSVSKPESHRQYRSPGIVRISYSY